MRYTVVILAVVSALFCRAFLVSVYKVPTQTMAPTILAGDFLLASQTAYGFRTPWSPEIYFRSTPLVGELIVFTKDHKTYIKRVVAVEKDNYEFAGGRLRLNGRECGYEKDVPVIENEAAIFSFREKCAHFGGHTVLIGGQAAAAPVTGTVPSGKLLVVSDNRNPSETPEPAELILIDQIIGKPVVIWMSYSATQDFISETLGVRWNRILTKVQ